MDAETTRALHAIATAYSLTPEQLLVKRRMEPLASARIMASFFLSERLGMLTVHVAATLNTTQCCIRKAKLAAKDRIKFDRQFNAKYRHVCEVLKISPEIN